MKKRLPVVVVFLLFSVVSYSQNNFVEGYVVTSRDTLRGFIFDKQLDKETRRVQFKSSLSSTSATEYKPLDIIGFYVAPYGEFYLGQAIDIDVKPVRQGMLESNPAARFKKDTVFLKQLARGKANLYFFRDSEKSHFFLQKENGPVKELLYIVYQTGDVTSKKAEIFRNQLSEAFADCSETSVKKAEYSKASLTKAFAAYNTCMGAVNNYAAPVEKPKTQLSLLAGAVAPVLNYQGGDDYNGQTAKDATFTSAPAPLAGVMINFGSKRPSNPISLGVEVLYRKDAHDFHIEDFTTTVTINVHYHSIRINPTLNYTFINTKLKPYLKAGVASGMSFGETNQMEIYRTLGGLYADKVYKGKVTDLSSFDMGFIGGIGVPWLKRFIAEVRYEVGVKGGSDARLNIKGASFVIGYRLK